MTDHKTGTREKWAAAREELLAREKEHTRLGDELARQRRELPWVRVEKEYRFDTDDGTRTLVDRGRSQRRRPTPERARRDHALRVAGATREVADVQAAHGLEFPLGVVSQQ
jgi:hypothetical protein